MATRRGGASWRPSPPAGKPRRGSLKGSFTSWAPLLACLPRRLAPRTEGLVTAPTIHDRCIPSFYSCLLFRTAPAFSFTKNIHQHYLQPPFVEPMCVSGHCTPQPRFSYGIVWGAYDMWMLQGSRAWSQWGVVHRFHVLLACRKFWFSNIIYEMLKALVITTYNDPEAAAKERKLLVDLKMLEGRGPNEFYSRLISQFEVCENTTRCDVSMQTVADTFVLGLPSALGRTGAPQRGATSTGPLAGWPGTLPCRATTATSASWGCFAWRCRRGRRT
jgi:hypothetical protein